MTLEDAVVGLKAYKEVDERMEQLWRNVDAAVVSPRMDTKATSLPKIQASDNLLELDGRADNSVQPLLADLEKVFALIAAKLPADLLHSLCGFMMNDVVPRLIQDWLSPAVPSSLKDIPEFEAMIEDSRKFCAALEEKGYIGFDELQLWVDNAPTIWLGKCRETSLDAIRNRLTNGIGKPKQVEKVEKHMVSLSEGKELATTGAGATAETNDWGDEWGVEWDDNDAQVSNELKSEDTEKREKTSDLKPEDDGADAWGWEDDEGAKPAEEAKHANGDDDDDSADAWGWGEEDATVDPEPQPALKDPSKHAGNKAQEGTRELVLKETYHISSMPEPVLDLIFSILEDAATLTKGATEHGPIASTAPWLFDLPTSALALFRAISPHYYALDGGGNMYVFCFNPLIMETNLFHRFLYNDAMYLAERLTEFSAEWKQREDLTPEARNMLQLDNDIKSLQNFANRSYAHEMNVQKTVLRDLVGGTQGLAGEDEWEAAIESGTARVRTMAATWEPILARSVWSQAVGSLADALATKLITDILEMSSIGQDDAYSIAKVIATATDLDDLFLPSKLAGTAPSEDEVPTTSQYAPNWLRLKYLSEVLQSNLNEVKFLWLESELSLYFTVGEVVDLIEASFENNSRTREAIREIQAKPQPLA